MKKMTCTSGNEISPGFKKLMKIMKLTTFLILFSVVSAFADKTYSQAKTLNLNMKNSTVKEVLCAIEEQSEFYFMYSSKVVDVDRKVSVDVNNQKINQVLDDLFAGTDVDYTIKDRIIVLSTPEVLNETDLELLQQKVISGTVTDQAGQPLPGVTVVLKGTTQGTITDIDGKYSLPNVPDDATLIFSFVGMKSQEIAVAGQSTINVSLSEEAIGLDEVVAIGYGVQKKATLTGSTSQVEGEALRASNNASVAAKLQGTLSGVSIINDNKPGGESTINIRGISTINNNTPLYVIDGIPSTDGLTQINSNDIESISVLKDASSSAIYGVRAANGVIIITTKRGQKGQSKPKLSISIREGIQQAKTNSISERLCNPQEYADLLWLEFKNEGYSIGDPGWYHPQYGSGASPVLPDYLLPTAAMEGDPRTDPSLYTYPDPYNAITKANKSGTDWYDEIFDPALLQEYNLNVSGGTEKTNYALSSSYLDQEGVVIYTGFKRFSLRLNADTKINDWLEIGESLAGSFSDQVNFSANSETNTVSYARDFNSIMPVYDIMGNFSGTKVEGMGARENPVAFQYRNKDNHNKNTRILGSIYGQINFLKDFHLKSFYGIDYRAGHSINRQLLNPESSQARVNDILTENYLDGKQWNWTNTLNYLKSFNGHNINVLLGNENVKYFMSYMSATREKYFTNTIDYMVLDVGEGNQTNTGNFDEWATTSYFGRINYDYMGKYLAEVVVRNDGSSRFAKKYRRGTFPAFSLGWRLSEEAFMANLEKISNLKIRLGWGMNGNDQIGNYNAYSSFGSDVASTYYPIDGSASSAQAGFRQLTLGDLNAKWETSTTTNLGIDAGFWENKFTFSVDVYNKLTSDMLYQKQLPDVIGNITLPNINIGEMRNKGIDAQFTYRDRINKDLNFSISANISHYKNEVLKLNNNEDEILYLSGARQGAGAIITAGEPMGVFYGLVVEGIFNTQEEVNNHVPYNSDSFETDTYSKPGVFKYEDVTDDGRIDSNDRTVIGNPHPDLTFGFNLNINYKNFDLSAAFNGSYGNDVIDYSDVTGKFNVLVGTNKYKERLYESWTQERYQNGDKITMPIALISDAIMTQPSSFFVQDGSYLRMKSLELGYTLPSRLLSKTGLSNVHVYLQGTNLLTFTKYRGLDPEVAATSASGYTLFGVDNGVYPVSQTFSLGVDINF